MNILKSWLLIYRTIDGNMYAGASFFTTEERARKYDRSLSSSVNVRRKVTRVGIDLFNEISDKFHNEWTDTVYVILTYDTRYFGFSLDCVPFYCSNFAFSTEDKAIAYLDDQFRILETEGWKPVYDKYTAPNIKRKYVSGSNKNAVYEAFICPVKLPNVGIMWKE